MFTQEACLTNFKEQKICRSNRSEVLLKVHKCRFENLPISSSSHENNMSKISH